MDNIHLKRDCKAQSNCSFSEFLPFIYPESNPGPSQGLQDRAGRASQLPSVPEPLSFHHNHESRWLSVYTWSTHALPASGSLSLLFPQILPRLAPFSLRAVKMPSVPGASSAPLPKAASPRPNRSHSIVLFYSLWSQLIHVFLCYNGNRATLEGIKQCK